MCTLYFRSIVTSCKQNDNRWVVRRFQSHLVYVMFVPNVVITLEPASIRTRNSTDQATAPGFGVK